MFSHPVRICSCVLENVRKTAAMFKQNSIKNTLKKKKKTHIDMRDNPSIDLQVTTL